MLLISFLSHCSCFSLSVVLLSFHVLLVFGACWLLLVSCTLVLLCLVGLLLYLLLLLVS
jgi:hypothetical protein